MGILNWFGRRAEEPNPQEGLAEVSRLAETDPPTAEKSLRRLLRASPATFAIGGAHAADLARVVESLDARSSAGTAAPLPRCVLVGAQGATGPTLADFLAAGRSESADALCLAWTEPAQQDPWAQVEALRILREEPEVALVLVGEECLIARRAFLLAFDPKHPESEEISQELIDEAKATGWQVAGA